MTVTHLWPRPLPETDHELRGSRGVTHGHRAGAGSHMDTLVCGATRIGPVSSCRAHSCTDARRRGGLGRKGPSLGWRHCGRRVYERFGLCVCETETEGEEERPGLPWKSLEQSCIRPSPGAPERVASVC